VVKHSLRISLGLLLAVCIQPAMAQAPVGSVPVKTYTGYYNDTAVYFTAFETNSANFAAANGLVLAPRLGQVNDANLPQMIFFMNGAGRQTVVLETAPGQPNYSPLWSVVNATWTGTDPMPLITNFASAVQWNQQGKLLVQETGIIFNGPVFMINRPLDLSGNGTLAPTISPNDFLGIDAANRTAYFKAEQGYYNGQLVSFLALEHAPGEIADAPGAIPVPTISLNVLGPNSAANFYEIDGQLPVIDSIPIRQVAVVPGTTTPPSTNYGAAGAAGAAGGKSTEVPAPQPAGQTGQQPGATQQPAADQSYTGAPYSPIWHVSRVVFRTGIAPVPLRSVQEIQQAASLGQVDVIPGAADNTFNCPIPFYYQSGTTNPVYTPPTTNPTTGINPGTGTTPGGTY